MPVCESGSCWWRHWLVTGRLLHVANSCRLLQDCVCVTVSDGWRQSSRSQECCQQLFGPLSNQHWHLSAREQHCTGQQLQQRLSWQQHLLLCDSADSLPSVLTASQHDILCSIRLLCSTLQAQHPLFFWLLLCSTLLRFKVHTSQALSVRISPLQLHAYLYRFQTENAATAFIKHFH